MVRYLRLLFTATTALSVTLLVRAAHADGWEGNVIVIDVAPTATELDPEQLRTLIARELGATAVPPGDPRAEAAGGTATINLDRTAGELSVTFLGSAAPITRRVPLPGEPASARNAAVALVGNLARDEASELAAELRKQHPSLKSLPEPIQPAEAGAPRDAGVRDNNAPSDELRPEALAGYGTNGVAVGGMVSYRHGPFVAAPSFTYHQTPLSETEIYSWRIGAGAAYVPTRLLRLEVLGVGGAHVYRGAGAAFLGSRGADGTRGFMGVWAGCDFVMSHFTLGAWLLYEGDLDRSSKLTNDPVTRSTDGFGGDTQHPVSVGQDAVGAFVRAGIAFNL
jgi:hypothetical protein